MGDERQIHAWTNPWISSLDPFIIFDANDYSLDDLMVRDLIHMPSTS